MKRDLRIIKLLLIKLEDRPGMFEPKKALWDSDPGHVLQTHMIMLEQGEFIRRLASDDDQWETAALTWKGHDYLESLRAKEAA